MVGKSRTVMVFGAFDGVHLGHIYYLKEAKKLGDMLIVAIARDHSKWKFRHTYSLPEKERLELVRALGIADEVILGSTTDALEKVEKVDPEILAITPYNPIDTGLLQKELIKRGLIGRVVLLGKYKPKIYDPLFRSERESGKPELMGLPPKRADAGAENSGSPAIAGESPFEKLVRKGLGNGMKGTAVFLKTSGENVSKVNAAAARMLARNGYVIAVSATRQYADLARAFRESGIPEERACIIDFANAGTGAKTSGAYEHLAIANPSDLTSLFIALQEPMKKQDAVVLVDSLSTLLVYNRPDVVLRFMNSLFKRIREHGDGMVVVSSESDTNAEVGAEIAQLCDRTVKI